MSLAAKRWLTSREFAEANGMNPSAVYNAVKAGRLVPALKTPGGHARFAPEQVGRRHWFSAKQFAIAVGVHRSVVKKAIAAGTVAPAQRTPSGLARFSAAQVEATQRAMAAEKAARAEAAVAYVQELLSPPVRRSRRSAKAPQQASNLSGNMTPSGKDKRSA